ncbi:MAG: hypothetical protein LBS25_02265 [Candidatus Symbiothrix sp.]|nr:hypothetical protein [Candidatus Symbiothrix sp.]
MKNKILLSAIALLLFGATLSAQPITTISVNGESGFSFENAVVTILNGSISVTYSDETSPQTFTFGNVTSLTFQTIQPVITWTGANTTAPTAWGEAGNWDENRLPAPGDYVIIPAGLDNYPTLSDDKTVYTLLIEEGASVNLNGHSITAQIVTDWRVAADTWYPIGFPYSIGALYGYGYAADGYSPDMIPYSDTPYDTGYYGDYIAKTYDGNAFNFTQTPAPAGTGYIYQFQPSYYGSNEDADKIAFRSDASVTVSESNLEITNSNVYYLLANPTLKDYVVTQGESENYYYQYNSGQNKFERPAAETSITFAPFEAFIVVKTSNAASLRSFLSVETVTALPSVSADDAVVSMEYYNLQGIRIGNTKSLQSLGIGETGVYIVKQIHESGKTSVGKSIIR